MFSLGLLSTPLPYLLLAAFYFFGFAMGLFNNSSGDETIETVSAVTIPVETKPKITDHFTFFYEQANPSKTQSQPQVLISKDTSSTFFQDTGTTVFQFRNIKVHEFLYTGFRFSRPPPAV